MQRIYDRKTPKKTANLSINSDLLEATRDSEINLSAVLEEALASRVADARRATWRAKHAEAIAAYNEFVYEHGIYSRLSTGF